MMTIKKINTLIFLLLILTIFALLSNISLASNIQAASCSQSDVQAAINSASNGDTVQIPAGTCTWNTQIRITKGITLQGAGAGNTIIKDGKQTGGGQSGALILWSCAQNQANRMTGIEFQDGGRTTAIVGPFGNIIFDCTNTGTTSVRVDHNKFDHMIGTPLVFNTAIGVVDHNTFLSNLPLDGLIRDQNPYWNVCDPTITSCTPVDTDGYKDGWGDHSWHDTITWGSKDFLFVEDNSFSFVNPDGSDATARSCHDGEEGTRLVWRFNTMYRCAVSNHGTESGGRKRGSLAMEIYKNGNSNKKWDGGTKVTMSNVRSGSVLMWDNVGTNFGSNNNAVTLDDYRTIADFNTGFFASSGKINPTDAGSQWDVNDPANPQSLKGVTSYTVSSANCVSGGSPCANPNDPSDDASWTITVSPDPSWTVDWTHFIIRKTSPCDITKDQCSVMIMSSTQNTISFNEPSGLGTKVNSLMHFAVDDTFEINKIIATLDQPGVSGGSLVTCGMPCLTAPAGWNDQIIFPSYSWQNTNNGKAANINARAECGATCFENKHFYNYNSNFDGATGVGVGPIANRPSTCTPGVLYWATDEGEWDSTHAGADGRAYKCTSANSWTLYYTPYAYPHPLVTNEPPPSDTTPPVISNGKPAVILPAGTTSAIMNVSTNENAVCKYSTVPNTAYSSMANTFSATGATFHSTTINSLSNGNSYNYYIRCQDSAGNANTNDFTISFSVASASDAIPPTVSITYPLNNAKIGNTTTITATASDNVGVVGVQFKLDGNNLGAEDTTSPYSISWDTKPALNGAHVLTAVARDAAGNSGTSSPISVNVNNVVVTGSGDLNGDKQVDILDLTMITQDFGKASGFNPAADVAAPYGSIDIFDVMVVVKNFGKNY